MSTWLFSPDARQAGTIADGEGVLGLQRAFHQAGTHNVVASLWDVNPTSMRELLMNFIRNLSDGKMSKSEALRQGPT